MTPRSSSSASTPPAPARCCPTRARSRSSAPTPRATRTPPVDVPGRTWRSRKINDVDRRGVAAQGAQGQDATATPRARRRRCRSAATQTPAVRRPATRRGTSVRRRPGSRPDGAGTGARTSDAAAAAAGRCRRPSRRRDDEDVAVRRMLKEPVYVHASPPSPFARPRDGAARACAECAGHPRHVQRPGRDGDGADRPGGHPGYDAALRAAAAGRAGAAHRPARRPAAGDPVPDAQRAPRRAGRLAPQPQAVRRASPRRPPSSGIIIAVATSTRKHRRHRRSPANHPRLRPRCVRRDRSSTTPRRRDLLDANKPGSQRDALALLVQGLIYSSEGKDNRRAVDAFRAAVHTEAALGDDPKLRAALEALVAAPDRSTLADTLDVWCSTGDPAAIRAIDAAAGAVDDPPRHDAAMSAALARHPIYGPRRQGRPRRRRGESSCRRRREVRATQGRAAEAQGPATTCTTRRRSSSTSVIRRGPAQPLPGRAPAARRC